MASQIISLTNVYSRVYWGADPQIRVTGLCEGNLMVTGEFPTQRVSNAENVSIWWRHHGFRPTPTQQTQLESLGCIDEIRAYKWKHPIIQHITMIYNCPDILFVRYLQIPIFVAQKVATSNSNSLHGEVTYRITDDWHAIVFIRKALVLG